ncbi:MAG: molybdopterin cofactor-binding domain-containing protein [Thermomicrobiales bacterium]
MGGTAFAIAGCYRIPNLDIKGYEVLTNRLAGVLAPGNLQASFAVESVLDDLAGKLGWT